MAKNTKTAGRSSAPASPASPAPAAATGPGAAAAAAADDREAFVERQDQRALKAAEDATAEAEAEGRLPAANAVTNPAPATTMDSASGAFVEDEIKQGVPVDHPSIENNPRFGTSAVQNGMDMNDPNRRDPTDPKFAGQGLDLSVYGDAAKK